MQIRVRRAVSGDELTLRALRLEALSESPAAFGSTYEREVARTPSDWQRWLSPGATFILDDDDRPVGPAGPGGLVAGVHDQHDRTVVHLMAMWVHPALRATRAADALVASVLAWAVEQGAREVRLQVVKGNDRAERCYQRNGFRRTGRETVREERGIIEIEMARAVGM
jgi:GNAT superfamily N-acetyltransferase